MTTVSVSLPKALHGFVEKRMKAAGYEDASAYFQALVREDQRRLRDLKQKIRDGLSSGECIEVTPQYWAKKKAALRAKIAKLKHRS